MDAYIDKDYGSRQVTAESSEGAPLLLDRITSEFRPPMHPQRHLTRSEPCRTVQHLPQSSEVKKEVRLRLVEFDRLNDGGRHRLVLDETLTYQEEASFDIDGDE
jgi:hypothetical protein